MILKWSSQTAPKISPRTKERAKVAELHRRLPLEVVSVFRSVAGHVVTANAGIAAVEAAVVAVAAAEAAEAAVEIAMVERSGSGNNPPDSINQ